MNVHGIIFNEFLNGQDRLSIEGADISELVGGSVFVRDQTVGRVTAAKKLFRAADCQNDSDRALLDVNKDQPLIRVSATIPDDSVYQAGVEGKVLCWSGCGTTLTLQPRSDLGFPDLNPCGPRPALITHSIIIGVQLHQYWQLAGGFRVYPGLGV